MKKLILGIVVLAVFLSCGKNYETPIPTCQRVYHLSDKYRLSDTMYLRTDSIWPWGRHNNVFCGADTLMFKSDTAMLRLCSENMLEFNRWVVGDKKTEPKLFK